jgi:hypothetical protein
MWPQAKILFGQNLSRYIPGINRIPDALAVENGKLVGVGEAALADKKTS